MASCTGKAIMRNTIFTIACVLFALVARPSLSSACSLAIDWAEPPAQVQDYDPALAPAPPEVAGAEAHFYYEEGTTCTGVSSCGDYAILTVSLASPPAIPRVRVTYDDGRVEYGMPRPLGDGTAEFSLAWPKNEDDPPGTLVLEVVSDEGYPSQPVEVTPVVVGADTGGCTVGASGPSSGSLLLLGLVALALRHGRRRARA